MEDTPPTFPAAYRHFVEHGLTDLAPWSLQDDSLSVLAPPNFERSRGLAEVCRQETGIDFDVYLFARRHDQDDYAFFVVRHGRIEDRVISRHLAFGKRLEVSAPIKYEAVTQTFLEWVRATVLEDIEFELTMDQDG